MNWEALGTIAEIVGAAAVLITLIYLSIQTRLTRIAAEETSKHATQQATSAAVEMYSGWRAMSVSGADVPGTVSKAKSGEALTDRDVVILEAYFQELFFVSAAAYRSALHATSGHMAPNDARHLAFVLGDHPFAYEYWQRMKVYVGNVCAELVYEVDKLTKDQNGGSNE